MRIDDKYSLSTDRYNWIITETYTGKDKDGSPKEQTRDHFFPSLSSCVNWLIENNCKDKKTLQEIKAELEKAKDVCKEVLGKVTKF
jgi:hypothetical protein